MGLAALLISGAAAAVAGRGDAGAVGDGSGARGSKAPPLEAARPSGSDTGPGPSVRVLDRLLAGFSRDEPGARAAAMTYTASLSQELLYMNGDEARLVLAEITSEESRFDADGLVSDLEELAGLLAEGEGVTWWSVIPMAIRVEDYTADRARVSVWQSRVLYRDGAVPPQSSWVTETVDLVWEDGDWRLDSMTEVEGPTPMLDASDEPVEAEGFADAIDGFEQLGPGGSER